MKKERYEEAQMELIHFDEEDVIATSLPSWNCPNETECDEF